MENTAHFLFYDALNDFLPRRQRGQELHYAFSDSPAVKDAIEALGIPHPEVGAVLLNGEPVPFTASLPAGAQVEVFSFDLHQQGQPAYLVQLALPVPCRFVLDVHLGSLARALRMLGFDTCYETTYTDSEIAQMAARENRIVLTRDIGLLKQRIISWGYWLRSQHLREQVQEVLLRYGLLSQFRPFTRCMACNGSIVPVSKAAVMDQLPPKTQQYFHEFYQCRQCQRVYWKGSHYERMQEWVQQLQGAAFSATG